MGKLDLNNDNDNDDDDVDESGDNDEFSCSVILAIMVIYQICRHHSHTDST